jgi:uncharacterized protein YqeY
MAGERDLSAEIRSEVGAALTQAMKARDGAAVAALRGLAAAIDNAGAVPLPPDGPSTSIAVSRSLAVGAAAGASETARRLLSAADLEALIALEIQSRREAAASFAALGRPADADRARAELAALLPVLARLQVRLEAAARAAPPAAPGGAPSS